MTIRNMKAAFRPESVAVVGASVREGAVGHVVMKNILDAGFAGPVFPVNPKYEEVMGRACVARAADLPEAPDLAVLVTPPETVPGIIADFGARGTRAAVVITAGLNDENGLRRKMLDAARPHMMRIIGPNTLGLMIPPIGLNAGFAHMAAAPGNLALLSQSGALATSLIDWSAERGVGFSHIVSLGDMADVDVGDYLDLLAGDPETSAILMYLETIPEPRKFMSAARAAARVKPVIAIKSGRHEEAAQAAATHTGALSGADRVVDAALRRAGILRVRGLAELFDAAETIARFPPIERARVGIVTNGGGAGVLAVDQLIDGGNKLAVLSKETLATLDEALPENWSHANPVDIIGDAPAERYSAAVKAVAADPGVDALVVINCPTGLASPLEAASAVAGLVEGGTVGGKPLLACWLGEAMAEAARERLHAAGVASFDTPAEAAGAIAYLNGWTLAQKALKRVPASSSSEAGGRSKEVADIFAACAKEGRAMLTEPEAKAALAAYAIAVPEIRVAATPQDVKAEAEHILKASGKVVVKLVSKAISHKSDVGGVVLNLETAEAAVDAAKGIEQRVRRDRPEADIEGYAVQPMVEMKNAHELIIGMSRDPIFGPVMLFGAGGTAVEVMDDTAVGLPPLDDVLGADMVARTRIGKLLEGYRDRPAADMDGILRALDAASRMVVDFPCIAGMDINPLLANDEGVMALDARIEIDVERAGEPGPTPELAIRPYPARWQKSFAAADGRNYDFRPIRPADVQLYARFLDDVSPEDIRLRFMAPRRDFPQEMLIRLTQLDYDREMAFVALDHDSGELAGIGRLICLPDRSSAEFALLVRTDLQGKGIGSALLEYLVEYGRDETIGRLEGVMLEDNAGMVEIAREQGFRLKPMEGERGVLTAVLDLK